MIDIGSAVLVLCRHAKGLQEGEGVRLSTYKRDRHVTIFRLSGGAFRVVEDGFQKWQSDMDGSALKKCLRAIIKREFPRSNKAHVTKIRGL